MVSRRMSIVSALALLMVCSVASAATINVPADYGTIQAAINAANAGDTVLVAAGTYAESLDVGKSLTIQGAGPGSSIINPNSVSEGYYIVTISGNDVVLDGFTITNPLYAGTADASGVVVWSQSNVTISNCEICAVGSASRSNISFGTFGVNAGPVDGLEVSNCSIHDLCHASSGAWTIGIFPWGNSTAEQARNLNIHDNDIYNIITPGTYDAGIAIGGNCAGITVANNDIYDVGEYGIASFASVESAITFSANDISDAGAAGMRLRGPYADVMSGNSITGTALGIQFAGLSTPDRSVGNTAFGSGLAEFIRLDASIIDVDATSATFSGAGDDQAIEAKVHHDVDDAALGHVDWGQGAAATATIVASEVTGTVGQTVQLSAKLTAAGAPAPGATVTFLVDGSSSGSGTTDGAGVAAVPYAIATAGNKIITASCSGVSNYKPCSDTATLTVNAAKPTSITLTVTPGSVTSGDAVTCTVMGDNNVDYTDACTYYAQYGAGGSWADNVYTSAKAGTWNLTAVYNTLADSKPLTVAAGAATSVTLTPATATINAGDSQAYVVTATDAAGNTWNPVGVIAGGAGTWAGNTYTSLASEAGSALTMTATVGTASDTATLSVNAAAGPGSVLAWDKDTQKFYLCSNATNPETGTLITGSGDYGGIAVVVSGGGTNVTVSVGTSSLRVTWYMRSGALYRAYQYSTISSVTKTATYDGRRTLVDGTWKTGFWGLTHTISGGAATYGSAQQ